MIDRFVAKVARNSVGWAPKNHEIGLAHKEMGGKRSSFWRSAI